MSDIVLRTLSLIIIITQWGGHYYWPYFIDEETDWERLSYVWNTEIQLLFTEMGKGELMADTRKLTDGNKKTGMEDWARPEPLLKSLLFLLFWLLSRCWHSDPWHLWSHVLIVCNLRVRRGFSLRCPTWPTREGHKVIIQLIIVHFRHCAKIFISHKCFKS